MTEIEYAVLGQWVSPNEDITEDVYGEGGLAWSRGRDVMRAFMPPMAGHLDVRVDSSEGQFAPFDPARYGRIHRGVRIRVDGAIPDPYNDDDDAIARGLADPEPAGLMLTRPQVTGILWKPVHDPAPPLPSVQFQTIGVLGALAQKPISMPYVPNILTSDAMQMIFDAAQWPAALRHFQVGLRTLDWFGGDYDDAFRAAEAVLNTEGEGAALYDGDDASAVFEDSGYRTREPRCTTVQASFSEDGTTQPSYSEPASYDDGTENLVNYVSIPITKRSAKPLQVVWPPWFAGLGTGDSPIVIPASGTASRPARVASDPFINAVTPVEGVDFQVTAGAIVNVELDRDSGNTVNITFVAGPAGATVEELVLRAEPVTADINTNSDGRNNNSIAAYGYQPFNSPTIAEISEDTAASLVEEILSARAYPHPRFRISVNNLSEENVQQQWLRDISDRIALLTMTTLGLDTPIELFIELIEQRVDGAGGGHVEEATYTCQTCDPVIDPVLLSRIPRFLGGLPV